MGFHMMNAYDESKSVVRVVGCFMNKFSMSFGEKGETENATLVEWTLDLKSGDATKRVLYVV
jgi:carotenoid cleavage dioxygenase-like enzyme